MAVTKLKAKVIKSTRKQPLRMTEAARLEQIKSFIRLCFISIDESTFKAVCARTGLCYATVSRLFRGDFTLSMHTRTLQAMATAAGLRLSWTPYRCSVVLIDDRTKRHVKRRRAKLIAVRSRKKR